MNILTVLPVKNIIRNEGDDIFSHNKNKTTSSNADKLQSVLTLVQTLADSQNIRERQVILCHNPRLKAVACLKLDESFKNITSLSLVFSHKHKNPL